MSDWQTIDSAPKDGKAVLMCVGNWMTVGSWHKHADCWVCSGPTYGRYPADEQPTHWMPLPPSPEEQS